MDTESTVLTFADCVCVIVCQEMDRVEQLQSKLHSYTQYGLPKVPRLFSFHQDSWEEEETNLAMEDSWKMLLDDPEVEAHTQWECVVIVK